MLSLCTAGCDQNSTGGETSPAVQATSAVLKDPYDDYAREIQPLLDELIRMRLLLATRDGTNRELFAKQYREVQLQHTKVSPKLAGQDRERSAWAHIEKAMASLDATGNALEMLDRLTTAVANERANPSGGSPGSAQSVQNINAMIKATEMITQLSGEIPQVMADAGGQIQLAEDDVRSRR